MHFLFSVYGLLTVAFVTLIGGFVLGSHQEDWKLPWNEVSASANPLAAATTFAWCLVLFANLFFVAHLAAMWLRWSLGACPATASATADQPEDATAGPASLADPT